MEQTAPEKLKEQVDPKFGEVLFYWRMPEFMHHHRGAWWYAIFLGVSIALILWAILSSNYIFAVLVVLIGIYLVFEQMHPPYDIPVVILTTGLAVGDHYHEWSEIKDFSIAFKPPEIQKLYFDFKNWGHPDLSLEIPDEVDPTFLREVLLEYVAEDLEHDEERLTDVVRRLYKL